MANETELRELEDRVARLGLYDQLRLMERVLASIRKTQEIDEAAARAEIAAQEAWHLQRQQSSGGAEGSMREAG